MVVKERDGKFRTELSERQQASEKRLMQALEQEKMCLRSIARQQAAEAVRLECKKERMR